MAASVISMSSSAVPSPSEEDAVAALLMGMIRAAAARRGRFLDGVSGADTPSSSSEADTASENATLRFAALPVREGVKRRSRIADLVGDADRECDGVLMGVFIFDAEAAREAEAAEAAFFSSITLTVAWMDSFMSTHSSSIIFTRRLKILSETPYLSTNGTICATESWAGRVR